MSRAAHRNMGNSKVSAAGLALVLVLPPGAAAGAASLPDSVLATVGERAVTVSSFQRAWSETHPGASASVPTPEEARGFLEALVDRELIATAATREPVAWTAEDSAYFAAARDRMLLRPALESALAAARGALAADGDSAADAGTVGIAARERAIQSLAPRYDEAQLQRMAAAFAALPRPSSDSSLAAQMRALSAVPEVTTEERAKSLATTAAAGNFTVGDLVDHYASLQPVYRPRVTEADQVRNLVDNGLFERWLRLEATRSGIDRTPEFQAALERERELIAVRHLMEREVYDPIPEPDASALEHFHRTHSASWTLPVRLQVITLTLPGRREATKLALELANAAYAESLAARGRRQGARYEIEISAESDSALFEGARRSGPGAVIGPDSVAGGWRVTRVQAVLPARVRPLDEVRPEVRRAWHEDQVAGRLRALIERERKRVRVRSNDAVLVEMTEP